MEPLENRIKGKLQQSKIELNTDELWKEVYPHIKPKRNKRYLIFLFAGLFWLVSMIGVAWYFKSSQPLVESKPLDDQITIASNKKASIKSSNIPKSSEEASSDVGIEENAQQKVTDENNRVKKLPIIPATINAPNNADEKIVQPAVINKNSKVTLGSPTVLHTTPSQTTVSHSGKSNKIENKESTFVLKESNIGENTTTESVLEKVSFSSIRKRLYPLAYSYPQPTISNEFKSLFSKSNSSRYSIYLEGGVFMTDRLLDYNGTEPIENHTRWLSEKPLESIAAQFGLNYHISSRFNLSIGINYLRINEKVEDTYSVTEKVLLENVIIENIISSRGTEPVYGNIEVDRTTTTKLKAFNRYNDIALSLDATYRFNENNFSPYVSLGLQQSVRSMQSGTWLLEDNIQYDIADDQEGYLKKNYGLGLRVGGGAYFKMSELTSLKIGARYIHYTSPITNANFELNQKYKLLGLNLGLNINI